MSHKLEENSPTVSPQAESKKPRRRGRIPEPLRIRTAVACLECKKHKLKCIGQQPCDRCVKKKLECIVKIVPKVTVSRDELTDNVERLALMQRILSQLAPGLSFDRASLQEKADGLGTSKTAQNDVTRESSNGVKVDSGNQPFFDNIGNTANFLAQVQDVLSVEGPVAGSLQGISGISGDEHIVGRSYSGDAALRLAVGALPQKEQCMAILTTFLEVAANNNYFYYDAHDFLTATQNMYSRAHQVTPNDRDFVCVLLMSLAVGSLFSYVSQDTAVLDKRDRTIYPGTNYYNAAKILASHMVATASLDSVIVFLLMGIYLICSTQPLKAAYAYIGTSLRAAIVNNLHRTENEQHKRLFWSVYTLDRKMAISLGKPESLPLREISTSLPEYNEELDSSLKMAAFSTINLATTISLLTFKIYDTWAQVCKNKKGLTYSMIHDLMLDLENWRKSFPPPLDPKAALLPNDRSYRGVCHILFQYNLARMALGRPFLLWKLVQKTIDPSISRLAVRLTKICFCASVEIIDLLTTMKDNQKFSVFSYQDYTSCHSAAIIFMVYFLIDPSDKPMVYLERAIDLLNVYAKYSSWSTGNLTLIMNLKTSLQNTPQYTEWSRVSNPKDHPSSSSESYPASLTGSLDIDTTAIDATLDGLASSDFFNSIIADSSFSFIQNSSIEALLFPTPN